MRLSQEALAEQAELSSGFIANMETGRSWPSSESLARLSEALDIEAWKLLVDPHKTDISYTQEELSLLFDRAKSYALGELSPSFSARDSSQGESRDSAPRER